MRRTPLIAASANLGLTLLVSGVVAAAGPDTPRYVEETARSGIRHVNTQVKTPQSPESGWEFHIGGGLAVLDCDEDGRPDLYLAGGSSPAALYRNVSKVGGALRFKRSKSPATDIARVVGAYPVDIDGDRHDDLVVLRAGENVLLRGLGGCRFERANDALGFDGGDAWTTAFSATWEGSAALPTLAFGNYLNEDDTGTLTGGCGDNVLVRPDATGTAYGPPTPLTPSWCALAMLFSDWDRSGRRDLRVTNDRFMYGNDGEDQLWRVEAGIEPRLYTREDGWELLRLFGMGIASHDLTGDGYPEVVLTNIGGQYLQALADGPERPTYTNISTRIGAGAAKPFTGGDVRPSTGWHPEFQDVNNDGLADLFISKGNVDEMRDYAAKDPNNLLLQTPDGMFFERAEEAGIIDFARTRGAALVDFNLDGLLDLVDVNLEDRARIWRNVGSGTARKPAPMGDWLALRLDQPGPNTDAIGAWIEVGVGEVVQRREVTVGGGHAGGQLGWVHFGLGEAPDGASVRVQWPDGRWGPWLPVAANGFAIIERGADAVTPWQPGD